MKVHKLFIYLLIAGSFFMLTACGGGGGGSAGTGELAIDVTDAKPLLPDGVTNLWVTFTGVLAHKSGGGWESLPMPENPYTVDLLKFYSGNTAELVPPVLIESGKYTQIRLIVSKAEIKFANLEVDPTIEIPSENLKTDKNFTFDLESGGAVDILIDFDLSQSIIITDNGSGTLAYKLKPVLHIVETSKAATISGEIVQGSDAIVTLSVYNPDLDVYEEYTKVEVVSESDTEATGFVLFCVVPNNDLDPPQDYKVEIDVDKDDTVNYSEEGIVLEEGEDYPLGTIS